MLSFDGLTIFLELSIKTYAKLVTIST